MTIVRSYQKTLITFFKFKILMQIYDDSINLSIFERVITLAFVTLSLTIVESYLFNIF